MISINELLLDKTISLNFDYNTLIKAEDEIIAFKDFNTNITLVETNQQEYYILCECQGVLVLPCTRTLDEVDYEISLNFEIVFGQSQVSEYSFDEFKDLKTILYANILLEKPVKIYSQKGLLMDIKFDEDIKDNKNLIDIKDLIE